MTKPARSLEFDPVGFEDLAWWIEKDRKKALRIIKLIKKLNELLSMGLANLKGLNTIWRVAGQGG